MKVLLVIICLHYLRIGVCAPESTRKLDEDAKEYLGNETTVKGERKLYRVGQEFAAGFDGKLYLAKDVEEDKFVAVKVFGFQRAYNNEQGFYKAMKDAKEEDPTLIAWVPDLLDTISGMPSKLDTVLVITYLEGRTLEEFLQEKLENKEIVELDYIKFLSQNLFATLKTVHLLGHSHRDVSRTNIMIVGDQKMPYLVDFSGDDPTNVNALGDIYSARNAINLCLKCNTSSGKSVTDPEFSDFLTRLDGAIDFFTTEKDITSIRDSYVLIEEAFVKKDPTQLQEWEELPEGAPKRLALEDAAKLYIEMLSKNSMLDNVELKVPSLAMHINGVVGIAIVLAVESTTSVFWPWFACFALSAGDTITLPKAFMHETDFVQVMKKCHLNDLKIRKIQFLAYEYAAENRNYLDTRRSLSPFKDVNPSDANSSKSSTVADPKIRSSEQSITSGTSGGIQLEKKNSKKGSTGEDKKNNGFMKFLKSKLSFRCVSGEN